MTDTAHRPAPDLSGIVKAYDVRGVAGEQLTVEVARALGAAFADLLDAAPLIVAHDMRVSSPELSRAFVEGAVRRGSTVAFAGLSSTDQLYCASGLHDAAGAMFTASHNPAPDNGIKMCRPGARPIGRDTGLQEIRRGAEAYLAAGEIPERAGGSRRDVDTLEDYVDTMLRLVPIRGDRRLRVVVDAANAMGGHTVPAVVRRLPTLEIIPLYFELDGTFPNHEANPLDPTNLRDLQAAVRREGADLGLAFDGDADRCFVVDEKGDPVSPSAVTALIATREIARARAEGEDRPAVVANLVSSRHVQEAIEAAGGRRIRSQVGHSLIKALMAENSAIFGGEHSAHYYFRDFFFADSGMLAALHVLAALSETEGPLSELVAEHSPYVSSGEINSRVEDAQAARDLVRRHMETRGGVQIDDLDGMTVTHWDDAGDPEQNWWFSLRSSNTEPLLRLNVEAAQQATMERVRDEVLALVRGGITPSGSPAVTDAPTDRPAGVASGAPTGADLPGWARESLRCPHCGAELEDAAASLRCRGCDRSYDVVGGVPRLLPQD
ncbi:phosphomannomutase/phosphoglucomutase [Brachybacterium sp. EF45031]|uniref:phosphomannomutase/phosphoglucomutase n=1 Tax=Brachybacterium sillae TaxID=2810536 RepID=UPI00217E7DAB|nr:phosphomannomutase/phosphoglucomutase [Brachybacterium sillae]MCS6711020.1 phosphomannomutase/phosphoglucomutase [Brachybacterium sillae]